MVCPSPSGPLLPHSQQAGIHRATRPAKYGGDHDECRNNHEPFEACAATKTTGAHVECALGLTVLLLPIIRLNNRPQMSTKVARRRKLWTAKYSISVPRGGHAQLFRAAQFTRAHRTFRRSAAQSSEHGRPPREGYVPESPCRAADRPGRPTGGRRH